VLFVATVSEFDGDLVQLEPKFEGPLAKVSSGSQSYWVYRGSLASSLALSGTPRDDTGCCCLTLICFSFAWAYLAMWKVHRDAASWVGSLSLCDTTFGSASRRPDVLLIWRWTLQLAYAIVAVLLSVLAFTFTA